MSKKKNIDVPSVSPVSSGKAEKGKKTSAKTEAAAKATAKPAAGGLAVKKTPLAPPASAEPAVKKAAKKTTGMSAIPSPALTIPPVAPAAEPVKKAAPAKAKAASPAIAAITDGEIARLAYSYAEARGFQGGSPDADWYRAKQELLRLRGQ